MDNIKISDINLRNYKLVVFDIDGTLDWERSQTGPIHKRSAISVARGRNPFYTGDWKEFSGTISLADELEIEIPLVLTNGGMLQTRHEEMLSKTTLLLDVTLQVIKIYEAWGKDLVIYIDNGIYIKTMNKNISLIYSNVTTGLFEIWEWEALAGKLLDANKCLVVNSFVRENLIEIGMVFEKVLKGRADILHASTSLVEVMPKRVTKATGVRKLADSMGILISEIMAFGDFDNDAEMLAAVGLGLAVENATLRVKTTADLVIGSVKEHGPAKFLKELLDR